MGLRLHYNSKRNIVKELCNNFGTQYIYVSYLSGSILQTTKFPITIPATYTTKLTYLATNKKPRLHLFKSKNIITEGRPLSAADFIRRAL